MKNSGKSRVIVSLLYIISGVFIGLIPTYLMPVCINDEMKMACYYTKQAEIGLGLLITLLGIAAFVVKYDKTRVGISIAQIGVSLLVFLYPLKLTGLCKMSDMACRMKTLPALIIAGILLIVIALADILYLVRKDKE